MKSLIAAAIVALATIQPAKADELAAQEKTYLANVMGSLAAAAHCDGYELVPNAWQTLGDHTGISDKMEHAAFEALKMINGDDYDRTQLMPEVTRFMLHVADGYMNAIERKDFCPKFVPPLTENSMIRPSHH
jgi:hypothetical protein